jgi:hypothetical protein
MVGCQINIQLQELEVGISRSGEVVSDYNSFPLLYQDLSFLQGREDFPVQELIPEFTVK